MIPPELGVKTTRTKGNTAPQVQVSEFGIMTSEAFMRRGPTSNPLLKYCDQAFSRASVENKMAVLNLLVRSEV